MGGFFGIFDVFWMKVDLRFVQVVIRLIYVWKYYDGRKVVLNKGKVKNKKIGKFEFVEKVDV